MEEVRIKLLSREPHLSQILTGFTMLGRQKKWKLTVEDYSREDSQPYRSAMAIVSYRGKKLVYDMLDGYQHEDAIRYHLEHCDLYFKRSFSEKKNRELGLNWEGKMFPLGFNYHVSCRNHPMDIPLWKENAHGLLGHGRANYCNTGFRPQIFEEKPFYRAGDFTVMFSSRLWGEDNSVSEVLNEERRYINQMRIDVVRKLKNMPEIRFVGGLLNNGTSQALAPDLVMPAKMVDRRNYLRLMHKSDICIGTMGLHESIGWKTGEYVAAAKAIVNEKFHYTVPGDFAPEKNYLEFETAEQCIAAVESLIASPEKVYEMKCRNREYYLNYLRPDVLIRNTLDIVDRNL